MLAAYKAHYDEIAEAISTEMGAPITLAKGSQTRIGVGHISAMIEVLKTFKFEEMRGTTRLVQEPVGVCALITPWNWPMNQVAAKVVPALAAGCTMVLKPSEYSPFSAILWAKVMHEAGVPAGVFNLINGDGPSVGAPLSSHREVDMVSFTGSTRAGTEVREERGRLGQARAPGARRQIAECAAGRRRLRARRQAAACCTCSRTPGSPATRRRACWCPPRKLAEVEAIAQARRRAEVVVGDPTSEKTTVGPVVSKLQFDRVEGYIEKGIAEGAKLVIGGAGRPEGLAKGYFVKPTIFSNVRNDMTIAREEIFGPVLCILPYETEEQAVQIANDTPYGLAAYVWSKDNVRARRVGNRIRAGQVDLERRLGRHEDAVRRLQDVGQRPRIRRVRLARLPGSQGRDRSRRRLTGAMAARRWLTPFCGSRISSKRYRPDRPAIFERPGSRAAAGRVPRHHGRVRRRQVDAAQSARRPRSSRTTGRVWLEGVDLSRWTTTRARCCAAGPSASCFKPSTCCPT